MKTTENDANTTLEAQAAPNTETPEQKAPTKAKAAKQARRVAPAKPKATKKTTATKNAPKAKTAIKAPKATKPKAAGVRAGSKTETILDLLRRPKGATLPEIMEASSWQAHSCRGFISGTLGKKMGLTVKSEKRDDGTRVYSIAK